MDGVHLMSRILFSTAFVLFGINHLTKREAIVAHARVMKVPAPSLMVPLTGLMIILGGLSIVLGFYAKIGAGLIIIFLLPTTVIMHKFWGVEDEQTAQTQMTLFL